MRRRLPAVFYNTTSMIGMTIALTALSMIAFLFILTAFSKNSNPYMGLITFIGLPAVMLFGFVITLIGIRRAVKRARRGEEAATLPILDFNNGKHRYAFTTILVGGLGLMAISGFGTFQAYEYTESVEFCGKVCHSVMKPEYTAYLHSPHAKVACVECHIGSGAEWYLRSKVSGTRQLYSVLFGTFDRPIKTPVQDLRPASDTCQECHSPDHIYSQKLRDKQYFLPDDTNTPYQLSMLMKTGGAEPGATEGVHAHMYLDAEISYVSTDRQRQIIPYVEMKDKAGKVTIYRSTEIKATEQDLKKGERRIVDCSDCHNRPAHQYRHPEVSVNQAMSRGLIDPKIPEIKLKAVEQLEKPYKTEGEALAAIKADLEKYYKESHPKEAAIMAAQLQLAIAQIQTIYKTNYFPEMKVNWKGYPNNLDHMHSSGCFRCHDDKHVSSNGRVISKDCQSCHTLLSVQTPDGKRQTNIKGVPFQHPIDVGEEWKTTPCMDCHGKQPEK